MAGGPCGVKVIVHGTLAHPGPPSRLVRLNAIHKLATLIPAIMDVITAG